MLHASSVVDRRLPCPSIGCPIGMPGGRDIIFALCCTVPCEAMLWLDADRSMEGCAGGIVGLGRGARLMLER
eukprot:scaffold28840_cov49-Prasinocladus_malaysianus.AAC.3